jgi:tetratricopeptide (TPR) repeat protein
MGEVLPPARAAARRAARLDPALADAHTALGIAHEEAFEWDEAEAEYRRAIALDPNAAEARYRLGRTFVMQRRIPEAIAGLRLAKAHDPLYFFTATYLGWALTQAGEHDAGIAELRRGLELEPNALPPLTFLTFSYYSANRPDSAAVFARRLAVASSIPVRLGGSAFVLARIGHREEAEALVRRLEALPAGTWTRSSSLAFGYLGLGDTTRALAAMERAAATDGDLLITYLGVLAGDLWSSPRFAAVLRRFNLDPARMGGHAVAPASSRP